jgi:hypothetical protein
VQVEGNNLLVKLSSGELKTFNVPEARKFVVDGKDLSVRDLRPGTTHTATVKTTTAPVTVRTKAVQSGTVWFVSPPRLVILTLPNGENKQYEVGDEVKFILQGKSAPYDPRKAWYFGREDRRGSGRGITTATTVVGHAPWLQLLLPLPKPTGRCPGRRTGVALACPADVGRGTDTLGWCCSVGDATCHTGRRRQLELMMWAWIIFLVVLAVVVRQERFDGAGLTTRGAGLRRV